MKTNTIQEMEMYAKTYDVPIISQEGIDFIKKTIQEYNVKTILEIGSAIGYSASLMALCDEDIRIVTIERDKVRYNEAVKNINQLNLGHRIQILNDDAFNYESELKFDMIFIDAAKSQYTRFFEKFKQNLSENGIMVSDNLSFHGYVEMEERIQSKNLRQLVGKIRRYISFLENNEEFETTFYKIGDGMAISKRR